MEQNLPELRDIHLPEGVSPFPPAYGWWVILALIALLIVAHKIYNQRLKKSKKRYALQLLMQMPANNLKTAAEMSEILRRICVYKYYQATTLFGKEWIDFLNLHSKKQLNGKAAQLLIDAPYINHKSKNYSSEDVTKLRDFCQNWIGENL